MAESPSVSEYFLKCVVCSPFESQRFGRQCLGHHWWRRLLKVAVRVFVRKSRRASDWWEVLPRLVMLATGRLVEYIAMVHCSHEALHQLHSRVQTCDRCIRSEGVPVLVAVMSLLRESSDYLLNNVRPNVWAKVRLLRLDSPPFLAPPTKDARRAASLHPTLTENEICGAGLAAAIQVCAWLEPASRTTSMSAPSMVQESAH